MIKRSDVSVEPRTVKGTDNKNSRNALKLTRPPSSSSSSPTKTKRSSRVSSGILVKSNKPSNFRLGLVEGNNKKNDWKRTPTGLYIKTVDGKRAQISRFSGYTSRKGNDYKTTYRVFFDDKYLGQKNTLKNAIKLAETKKANSGE